MIWATTVAVFFCIDIYASIVDALLVGRASSTRVAVREADVTLARVILVSACAITTLLLGPTTQGGQGQTLGEVDLVFAVNGLRFDVEIHLNKPRGVSSAGDDRVSATEGIALGEVTLGAVMGESLDGGHR